MAEPVWEIIWTGELERAKLEANHPKFKTHFLGRASVYQDGAVDATRSTIQLVPRKSKAWNNRADPGKRWVFVPDPRNNGMKLCQVNYKPKDADVKRADVGSSAPPPSPAVAPAVAPAEIAAHEARIKQLEDMVRMLVEEVREMRVNEEDIVDELY